MDIEKSKEKEDSVADTAKEEEHGADSGNQEETFLRYEKEPWQVYWFRLEHTNESSLYLIGGDKSHLSQEILSLLEEH